MSVLRSSTACFPDPLAVDPLVGFKFGISNREVFFQDGEGECGQLEGGDVASIHSAAENDAIIELMNADGRGNPLGVWVGLVDVDQTASTGDLGVERFAWTDGSSFDFGNAPQAFPWSSSNPNNDDGSEHCVQIVDLFTDGEIGWNDVDCSRTGRPVICKFSCNLASASPTGSPLRSPTKIPTSSPSESPTKIPTSFPTKSPTGTQSTSSPSKSPTGAPIDSSSSPSVLPTESPSQAPTTELSTLSPSVAGISSENANSTLVPLISGFVALLILAIILWVVRMNRKPKQNSSSKSLDDLKIRVINTSGGDPNTSRLWGEHRPSGIPLPQPFKHLSFLPSRRKRPGSMSTINVPTTAIITNPSEERVLNAEEYFSWGTSTTTTGTDYRQESNSCPRYKLDL